MDALSYAPEIDRKGLTWFNHRVLEYRLATKTYRTWAD